MNNCISVSFRCLVNLTQDDSKPKSQLKSIFLGIIFFLKASHKKIHIIYILTVNLSLKYRKKSKVGGDWSVIYE